ncbi:leucyl aminopeptidase [Siculibacillus lacustris]|uniref:Probable cytosol aminopeptidase n=1 Tax=Siculibacillus lacustris TaxID=1549641 RepID=A0A4Q9VUC0_9HYPH|nr:leucyl aminopeptidase [Siculibacillus lacustris]TBW39768.1 leucyl aminopeptidase [Siculibacillus lacustris]
MTHPSIAFAKPAVPATGTLVILIGEDLVLPPTAAALDGATNGFLARAVAKAAFKAKRFGILDVVAPHGLDLDRVLLLGLGKPAEFEEKDWPRLGGALAAKLVELKVATATVLLERGDGVGIDAEVAADFGLGVRLRAWSFDRYKTKKKDDDAETALALTLAVDGHAAARKAWNARSAIADGVALTRELISEPANHLGTVEFAARAEKLSKLGVEVEVLGEKDLKKAGWGALLGVAQGSARPPRVVIMRWNGGDKDDAPIAFVGKGVVFDSGGISIKPASGMEDMKGDMGGAAVVTGLLHALAARKAKVNVVGAIGLVENMPDADAQRPGDVVTSLSGQTIEVINTDAEGRLVLADLLWHVKEKVQPALIVDLATLTGAVLVALGKLNAGLFSNSDELSDRLAAAGKATGETVWRMPLSADYDKLIDSQWADMKNTGGRDAGSITAAQFLKRFVGDVPWAHLDIAGTAMGSPATELNKAWASGWGVRLLDRLVADHYEK